MGHHKSDIPQSGQCWTVAFNGDITFGNANNAARTADSLILDEQLCPLPGAEPTHARSLVDQIKALSRKFEGAQGIHHLELDSFIKMVRFCLSMCILHHREAYIGSHHCFD